MLTALVLRAITAGMLAGRAWMVLIPTRVLTPLWPLLRKGWVVPTPSTAFVAAMAG